MTFEEKTALKEKFKAAFKNASEIAGKFLSRGYCHNYFGGTHYTEHLTIYFMACALSNNRSTLDSEYQKLVNALDMEEDTDKKPRQKTLEKYFQQSFAKLEVTDTEALELVA